MGQRAWRIFQAIALLTVAGLSTFTLVTMHRVGESVQTTLTELRRLQVSELSTTWTSGGQPYTHKAVQKDNEGFQTFVARFQSEVAYLQDDARFPPDE